MSLTRDEKLIEGLLKQVQLQKLTSKEANQLILKIRKLKKSLPNKW